MCLTTLRDDMHTIAKGMYITNMYVMYNIKCKIKCYAMKVCKYTILI